MSRLSRWLTRGPVLTDGAWGTELQRLGLSIGQPSDLWNRSRPIDVESLARAYAEAGSGVVLTNTFQSNPLSLEKLGVADLAASLNAQGVALSRAGAPGAGIFGAVGPTGLLPIKGGEAVAAAFRIQVQSLADAGVDAIVLETFFDLEEATLALLESLATGLPVVASFAFDQHHSLRGKSAEEVGRAMADSGADAVGANCGHGLSGFAELCFRLRRGSGRPVWVKPNAGLPHFENGRAVYGITPEAFAESWPVLVEAGASFLGGCCGAGPEHIRAMARAFGQAFRGPSVD